MDDARAADDGVGSGEGDLHVFELEDAAVGGGDYVAEVTGVAVLVGGGAVVLAVGVEVGPGGHASVGGVAELVDVEAVLARGESLEVAGNLGGSVAGLGEGDDSLDAGGAGEDADSLLIGSLDDESAAGGRGGERAGGHDLPVDDRDGTDERWVSAIAH